MTISSLAPTTNPGGGKIPRKRSWGQSLKKGVITGAVVGGSCASIVIAMGTWGDYPTRELVKTQARMFFAPDHVFEAKVLRDGKQDPAWLCWEPGHPAHACRPRIVRIRIWPRSVKSPCRPFPPGLAPSSAKYTAGRTNGDRPIRVVVSGSRRSLYPEERASSLGRFPNGSCRIRGSDPDWVFSLPTPGTRVADGGGNPGRRREADPGGSGRRGKGPQSHHTRCTRGGLVS